MSESHTQPESASISERESPDLEQLAELIAELESASSALTEYGEDHDLPAIECNARRVHEIVRVLDDHVPRATLED